MRARVFRHLFLLLLALVTLVPGAARAADRGMQFIGASRATPADIEIASRLYRAAGGRTQVSLLPFEFNPQAPFANATQFVLQTLPGLSGSLTVTLYVGWYPHDGQGLREQAAFWKAWQDSRPSSAQRALRAGYLDRLRLIDGWIISMNQWARANGIAHRLDFVVVPVLEDTCPVSHRAGYERLVDSTRSTQRADGVTRTTLRRSSLNENVFRIENVAVELHGRWEDVHGWLKPGDVWSNDGTAYSERAFLAAENAATDRGVSVLVWREAYNGLPNGKGCERNWPQRTVNPFTGSGAATEAHVVRNVLSQR